MTFSVQPEMWRQHIWQGTYNSTISVNIQSCIITTSFEHYILSLQGNIWGFSQRSLSLSKIAKFCHQHSGALILTCGRKRIWNTLKKPYIHSSHAKEPSILSFYMMTFFWQNMKHCEDALKSVVKYTMSNLDA